MKLLAKLVMATEPDSSKSNTNTRSEQDKHVYVLIV